MGRNNSLANDAAESHVSDMRFRRPMATCPRRRSRARRAAFTLIEASLAIVIVGVGVVAACELLAVGTRANADSHRLTTGLNLAANIRELAQEKTVDQILALNAQVFTPPRDARNAEITDLTDWEQSVTAARVNPSQVTVSDPVGSSSRLLRLTVVVSHRGKPVTREEWLLANTAD